MHQNIVKHDLMLEMFKDETDLTLRILECARKNGIIDGYVQPVYSQAREQVEIEFTSGGTEVRIAVIG